VDELDESIDIDDIGLTRSSGEVTTLDEDGDGILDCEASNIARRPICSPAACKLRRSLSYLKGIRVQSFRFTVGVSVKVVKVGIARSNLKRD